jgi:hypothetical protein
MKHQLIAQVKDIQFNLEGTSSQVSFLQTKTETELVEMLKVLTNLYYDKFYDDHVELEDHRKIVI